MDVRLSDAWLAEARVLEIEVIESLLSAVGASRGAVHGFVPIGRLDLDCGWWDCTRLRDSSCAARLVSGDGPVSGRYGTDEAAVALSRRLLAALTAPSIP